MRPKTLTEEQDNLALYARLYLRSGAMRQAEQVLFEKLDSDNPTPEDFFLLSVLALESGQPEVGQDRLERALRLLPGHPQLQVQRAALWQARYRPDRALACLAHAGSLPVVEGRGALLGAAGEDAAVEAFLRERGCNLPVQFRLPAVAGESVLVTLDDGPTPAATPGLLATLETMATRAGFFLCGARAAQHPELVQAMAAAGHGVFSHGFDHMPFPSLSAAQIYAQMERTEAVLSRFRPTPSPYPLRLPYGAGWGDPHVHAALAQWRKDCVLVQWSFDLGDWRLARLNPSAPLTGAQRLALSRRVEDFLASPYRPGSIVVLHDVLADQPEAGSASGAMACAAVHGFVHALQREGMTAADPLRSLVGRVAVGGAARAGERKGLTDRGAPPGPVAQGTRSREHG